MSTSWCANIHFKWPGQYWVERQKKKDKLSANHVNLLDYFSVTVDTSVQYNKQYNLGICSFPLYNIKGIYNVVNSHESK